MCTICAEAQEFSAWQDDRSVLASTEDPEAGVLKHASIFVLKLPLPLAALRVAKASMLPGGSGLCDG